MTVGVILDGEESVVMKYVTMEFMELIVACHVDNAWSQRNVIMSMEHV